MIMVLFVGFYMLWNKYFTSKQTKIFLTFLWKTTITTSMHVLYYEKK